MGGGESRSGEIALLVRDARPNTNLIFGLSVELDVEAKVSSSGALYPERPADTMAAEMTLTTFEERKM